MLKWLRKLFSKHPEVMMMGEDYTVPGCSKFNKWIERIKNEQRLTDVERTYILDRIREEVQLNPSVSYWNTGPIGLPCMWSFSLQDRIYGVTKAAFEYGL